jgi:hypothetical protein
MRTDTFYRDRRNESDSRNTPDTSEFVTNLRLALQQARIHTRAQAVDLESWRALREATRAFTRRCLTNHATPEATLGALKRALRTAAPELAESRPTAESNTERDVIATVVGWCIDDYYRAD